ncbi:MAG: 50S ribosomal protein L6 [Rhodobacteraceae bacterium]|nr:50S ribosomal protein L6 [Paracoccaceae bacterium]
MSKIGKVPIPIPAGVTVRDDGDSIVVKGPRGSQSFPLVREVSVHLEENQITLAPRANSKESKVNWGMCRTMLNNCILGVTEGFRRELEINGVGYRAAMQGDRLKIALGFSHDVFVEVPEGITITTPSNTRIIVEGNDKQRVGQVAADIRRWRPPEPYKGKGIRYRDEYIFRKQGKKK